MFIALIYKEGGGMEDGKSGHPIALAATLQPLACHTPRASSAPLTVVSRNGGDSRTA